MTNSSKVAKKLREKYGEEFSVNDEGYSFQLKTYQFIAYPEHHPEIDFVGYHNGDLSDFEDTYLMKYYSFLYSNKIKKYLEKYTSPCYVSSEITFDESIYKCNRANVDTLNLENAIKRSHYFGMGLYIYFFEELNEKTKEKLLTGVFNIIHPYTKKREGSVGLEAYFFKASILKKYTISNINYNHRMHKGLFPEDKYLEYVTNRLSVYFQLEKPIRDFNIDSLYLFKKEVTVNTVNIETENLNLIK